MHGALQIEKEEIKGLKFVEKDVLESADAIHHRNAALHKAATMGNNDHTKVKIVFETTEGRMEVETTVWAATENYVQLKGDVLMPIHSIVDVIIY